jgi:hypothetical protein
MGAVAVHTCAAQVSDPSCRWAVLQQMLCDAPQDLHVDDARAHGVDVLCNQAGAGHSRAKCGGGGCQRNGGVAAFRSRTGS